MSENYENRNKGFEKQAEEEEREAKEYRVRSEYEHIANLDALRELESLDELDELDSLDELDALDALNKLDALDKLDKLDNLDALPSEDEVDAMFEEGTSATASEKTDRIPRTTEEMIKELESIDELYEFAETLPPLTEEELAELEDFDFDALDDDDDLEDEEDLDDFSDEEDLEDEDELEDEEDLDDDDDLEDEPEDDEEALLADEKALLEDEKALLEDEESLPEDEESYETVSLKAGANVDVYAQLDSVYRQLIAKAHEARKRSYCPYSDVAVGAALLTASGKIFLGANIENASFTPTICAERVAFFKAISSGETNFVAIAVVGAKKDEEPSAEFPPCGVCRQVMSEFCDDDFVILLGTREDYSIIPFNDILPHRFTKDNF